MSINRPKQKLYKAKTYDNHRDAANFLIKDIAKIKFWEISDYNRISGEKIWIKYLDRFMSSEMYYVYFPPRKGSGKNLEHDWLLLEGCFRDSRLWNIIKTTPWEFRFTPYVCVRDIDRFDLNRDLGAEHENKIVIIKVSNVSFLDRISGFDVCVLGEDGECSRDQFGYTIPVCFDFSFHTIHRDRIMFSRVINEGGSKENYPYVNISNTRIFEYGDSFQVNAPASFNFYAHLALREETKYPEMEANTYYTRIKSFLDRDKEYTP